jgi:hypothetical protein
METDFLVSEYTKFLRERSVQGEANHIASRLSDKFVPASEESCGSLYWGHNCRSWRWRVAAPPMRQRQEHGIHFVGTSVDRRDQWATLPRIRRVIRSSRQSGLGATLIPLSGIRQGQGFLG